MNPQLPDPDYVSDFTHHWPWDKFGLPPEALYTTLHRRYNTRPSAILEPAAFRRDVVECANKSSTLNEFEANLSERMKERVAEMDAAWIDTSNLLGRPGVFPEASIWAAFIRLSRTMSSDRFVIFFDKFARSERERQREEMEKDQQVLNTLYPPRPCARQHDVDSTPPSPPNCTGTDTEPSIPSIKTESHPVKPEISTTQFHPDDRGMGLPSPASASSRNRRSTDGDDDNDLTSCKASLASAASETSTSDTSPAHSTASKERASAEEESGGVPGRPGERGCREGSSGASFPFSLISSLHEGVQRGKAVDQDQGTDVDRQKDSQWRDSVLSQNTTSAPPSPGVRPAKRKGISDGEDGEWQSNEESQEHSVKIRRL